jgi:hypothetical protein
MNGRQGGEALALAACLSGWNWWKIGSAILADKHCCSCRQFGSSEFARRCCMYVYVKASAMPINRKATPRNRAGTCMQQGCQCQYRRSACTTICSNHFSIWPLPQTLSPRQRCTGSLRGLAREGREGCLRRVGGGRLRGRWCLSHPPPNRSSCTAGGVGRSPGRGLGRGPHGRRARRRIVF